MRIGQVLKTGNSKLAENELFRRMKCFQTKKKTLQEVSFGVDSNLYLLVRWKTKRDKTKLFNKNSPSWQNSMTREMWLRQQQQQLQQKVLQWRQEKLLCNNTKSKTDEYFQKIVKNWPGCWCKQCRCRQGQGQQCRCEQCRRRQFRSQQCRSRLWQCRWCQF